MSSFNRESLIDENKLKKIERSIIKRYRKDIWARFIQSINEFELIEDGDRIAVAISGGKDSLLLAKLLQELKKHGQKDIELEFIVMDPGFNKEFRENIKKNCNQLNIPIKIYKSDVFQVADKLAREKPCYMCARMRRGFLYRKAKDLNCNKLALGHHFDDVVETIMLNILCSGNFKTMMPKLRAENFEKMEIIRPMYYIEEKDIIRFRNYAGFKPLDCGCVISSGELSSKRAEIKGLLKNLEEEFDNVKMSIFRSSFNVNSDAIIGWEEAGEKYSFLDKY